MRKLVDISYLDLEENPSYKETIDNVFEVCFKEENLYNYNIYISVILTNEENIKRINKKYRNIDKATDVLSFPMFEPEEIENVKNREEVLGDIIICMPIIQKQAIEYEHSLEREFSYMLVHGFYHLMGYDHMKDEDKLKMRKKEDVVLNKLGINR